MREGRLSVIAPPNDWFPVNGSDRLIYPGDENHFKDLPIRGPTTFVAYRVNRQVELSTTRKVYRLAFEEMEFAKEILAEAENRNDEVGSGGPGKRNVDIHVIGVKVDDIPVAVAVNDSARATGPGHSREQNTEHDR
jgi:hypothetical protein